MSTMQPSDNLLWQQGQSIEIEIEDLADSGDGVGRWQQRVVFVPDTVVGDRVRVRLVRVKPQYGRGKVLEVLQPSPNRQRPPCIVADKCGGCQWQQVKYEAQLQAKHRQVVQALDRIGGFDRVKVDAVLTTGEALGYRNKSTYPVRRSSTGAVKVGYYQKGTHKLVNLNQCPVQDARLDPFLAQIKKDIETRKWRVYDETRKTGEVRHLGLRVGRRTGDILLTLVARSIELPGLEEQAKEWLRRYPNLVGVCVNINGKPTNAIFGPKTHCVAGRSFLTEVFAGLTFRLQPTTFFQVNTEAAELIWQEIDRELKLNGDETVIDAYCGIGTFSLPLARRVRWVIGIESHEASVEQARENARSNDLTNVHFRGGKVEVLLGEQSPIFQAESELKPDIVLLDPPRQGCDRAVLEALLRLKVDRIAYISCKPATLARDLGILCESGQYQLDRVQPVDLFPQTAHVESIAFLTSC
ncbi:MAG: 23S rRNA (uracil(1939)-C(5))-methyltransferase RlmD [Cyanobacteria bacterium SBC]|nr:23S rRNA (uracil(1939)-C(5))-methyltransferase RlmD [Cyanobacteria bacterium SBC]